MKKTYYIVGLLLMVALVEGSTWTRPPTGQAGLWNLNGNNIYYDNGNATIGGISSEGTLGLISDLDETILSIDNNGTGDPVTKYKLSTTKLTMGIRDAGTGDPFEFNYGDGLDSSPELSISTDDVLIGTPTTGSASLIFNNKITNSCDFGEPDVDDTNYLSLPVANCVYTDFLNGLEGQLLVIICPRPTGVTITVEDTARQLALSGSSDFTCTNAGDTLTLFKGGLPFGEWVELSRSFNT